MAITAKAADVDALAQQIGIATLPLTRDQRIEIIKIISMDALTGVLAGLAKAIGEAATSDAASMAKQADATSAFAAALAPKP